MNMRFNSFSIVGLSCCGIHCALENFKHILYKTDSFIKKEIEFPFTNLCTDCKFLCDDICYSIQIVQISPNNEFAIISGSSYSVVKVVERRENYFNLLWNGENYIFDILIKLNTFQLTINGSKKLSISKIDDGRLESSVLEFPTNSGIHSEELYSVLESCLSDLNNILMGYSLPEPFFIKHLYSQLEKIFSILRNPLLPSLRFQRFVDDAGESLPSGLVTSLQQIIGQYTLNYSSLFSKFPSHKIKSLIDTYVEGIEDGCRKQSIIATLRPIVELAEMFCGGIRGNAKCVIDKLLLEYLRVEIKFQDEETILSSNWLNIKLEESDLISHNNLANKNKLILAIFDCLERFLPGIISDLNTTIQKLLVCLNGDLYCQLIPKLREVLITGQIPSYEVRKNEMEAIFLNSINGYGSVVQTTRLEHLICSNSEVFDIISDFFYHKMIEIRKCALEVYIRRAYMIYEICSFEQSQLASGQLCVLFTFTLPARTDGRNATGHEIKRSNSYVALMNNRATLPRKTSQIGRHQVTDCSLEKEDLSDGELPSEDFFQRDMSRQKSNDNDTDSAISVGACSLSELSATVSEHVDSDCVIDANGVKYRHSPSIHSLDREPRELSSGYLDNFTGYHHNRNASMFCNHTAMTQVQDFSSRYDLGVMIVFDTLQEVESNLQSIEHLLSSRKSSTGNMAYLDYDGAGSNLNVPPSSEVVLKLILRDPKLQTKSDGDVSAEFLAFCDKYLSFFVDISVSRITFLLQATDKTIRYFTFRNRDHFVEEIKLRNIDPILSFQLEINRLRNYHLERLPVPNRMMYVYMGRCRDMNSSITAEYRMFTRCIIHHKDFKSSTSSIDYMAKEAERNLAEAMDVFDIAWVDERAKLTVSNHIFFYFHSILCINKIEELENVVRAIIFKHGRRLWSLRITQAELKMSVKLNNGPLIPIRLWVHNEGGKSLDICIYREEIQFKTDHKVLLSWSPGKEGRYHGVPVDCFYLI